MRELALAEDRERIARDLHDTVIQRLFATGMSLQSTTTVVRTDATAAVGRIEQAIDDLDVTIKDIRTPSSGSSSTSPRPPGSASPSSPTCATPPPPSASSRAFVLDGPIDTPCPTPSATSVATLREALSNVARHAEATAVEVEITVDATWVARLRRRGGPAGDERPEGHGLRNMAERGRPARWHVHDDERSRGGTIFTWRVPLPTS